MDGDKDLKEQDKDDDVKEMTREEKNLSKDYGNGGTSKT